MTLYLFLITAGPMAASNIFPIKKVADGLGGIRTRGLYVANVTIYP
jgi:hypothetical protein